MGTSEPNSILDFYQGFRPDHRGRYLSEILSWDDSRLENVHDYIQWLFPTFERSAFQPGVPTLTTDVAAEFSGNEDLKRRLTESFRRMLQFYGYTVDQGDGPRVADAPNFAERADVWLTPRNHNHLRITRILKSLTALGLRGEAQAFLSQLERLYEQSATARAAIEPRSLQFWRSSVNT
jgi:hypothetical protein